MPIERNNRWRSAVALAAGISGATMATEPDPKDDPDHIPVEKRLSGDFGSPVEVMAAGALSVEQKRQILEVWLGDLKKQPQSEEANDVRQSILEAMASLERKSDERT
jgi:hypothetical protein